MVSHCVNPTCRTEFQLFNTGEIYAHERPTADTKFFWLCSACGPKVELYLDPGGCVSVRPRSDVNRPQPPHPEGYLRLVARPMKRIPWHYTIPSSERASFGFGIGGFYSDCDAA
jgi:hypothetical protein